MKKNLSILALSIISLFIVSCTGEENGLVEDFYKAYNTEDYSEIKIMTMPSIADLMADFVKEHYDEYGTVTSYNKFGFSVNDGYTILKYKCEFENKNKTIYERFSFAEHTNGELKLEGYVFSTEKWYIEQYEDFIEASRVVGEKYFDIILNDELDQLVTLLEDESLEEDFIEIIEQKNDYYGNVITYQSMNVSSYLYENEPYVTRTYECHTDGDFPVYEQIVFKRSGDDFYIVDYNYAGSPSDLPE